VELAAQLEKLEAQAKVATRYNELHADLNLKQHLLWYLRRRDAAAERERHGQEVEKVINALEAENAELRSIESRVETARDAHYRAGDAQNLAQAALYSSNALVAKHESELRHIEETRQRLGSQHAERHDQLAQWRGQRSQLTQALHMWASRAVGANQKVNDTKEHLEVQSKRLPEAEQAFRAGQEQLAEARSQLMQAESRLQLEQANLVHLERGKQALEQRRERLDNELATLAEPDTGALCGLEASLAELEQAVVSAAAASEALQGEVSALEERKDTAVEALGSAAREHAATEAQIATLRQIQAASEENTPLRDWLERHGLVGQAQLWQKLRIAPGWETAVEAVLRERLHALELSDPARLAGVVADQPPAKASLFLQGNLVPDVVPGFDSLFSKILDADAAVSGALRDWLGDVFVVEGLPDASKLPVGAVFVNREGHQFTHFSVSLHAPDAPDTGILARQAEIETLQGRLDELAVKLRSAQENLENLEAQLAERNAALEAARAEIGSRQKAHHDAQIEHLKALQALERYAERSAQVRAELDQIGAEMQTGDAALAECRSTQERIASDIAQARARLEGARAAHVEAEAALAAQRVAVQQAEREAQDAVFGERECGAKIAEIDSSVKLIDREIERGEAEIARLAAELADDPTPALRQELDAAVESRISCEKTLAEARNAVEAAAGALRELEEGRLKVEARVAPLRERVGELRLKQQAAQLNFEQFDTQLREANADETVLATAADDAPRPSALQGEITRINTAIAELGAVNLAALEELNTSRERKGFLDSQATDLEEAVKTLEDAIRRIDRETRELLRETFDSVNRHFGSLFPLLFGGGEAKLIMTGEEILDAGVQVMAHPPGKRNSSIHLLSGGEKALTAISLVFALFQLNPAPFCLLDEVDAPLDDTNTGRFCDLVKKMSAQTQFLFISHNKISMEMAQQLVGVTMPESGVSRVVAVDIDQALRMREELAA
jgi:chromosome segregation protein